MKYYFIILAFLMISSCHTPKDFSAANLLGTWYLIEEIDFSRERKSSSPEMCMYLLFENDSSVVIGNKLFGHKQTAKYNIFGTFLLLEKQAGIMDTFLIEVLGKDKLSLSYKQPDEIPTRIFSRAKNSFCNKK